MKIVKAALIVPVLLALSSGKSGYPRPDSADIRNRTRSVGTEKPGRAGAGEEIVEWNRLSRAGDYPTVRRPSSRPETSYRPSPPETPLPPEPAATPAEHNREESIESGDGARPGPSPAGTAVLPAAPRDTRIPVHFIRNDGQLDREVRYYMKGSRGSVYLTGEAVVFDFYSRGKTTPDHPGPEGKELAEAEEDEPAGARLVFRMRILDADPETVVEGRNELPGKINYFVGDRANWRTAIPTFEEVAYREIYPGIDLVCRFTDGNLSYRCSVAPGADPGRIAFRYSGVDGLEINPDGALIVQTAFGGFRNPPPRLYQEIGGGRLDREGTYTLRDNFTVGLIPGPYDLKFPLFIDF